MDEHDRFLPKYYKISREIIAKIQSGELLPGMKVPSENEIINTYNVSNTTARKILNEIENAGWATRIKGKGTFVKTRNVDRSVTRILGFTKNMIEAGYKPSTKLLDASILEEDYTDTINGRNYTLASPIYRIKRLRFADNVPMMLEVRYISLFLCPDINKKDLEKPLYDYYQDLYHHRLTEVNQMISTIIIKDEETDRLFGVDKRIPAFLVSGVTFTGREIILEMERSIYRGDRYSFSVRAT
ncbi:UTRA domain-containing protein [candidate division KSB1 bacterium]|nr:UTRA domain-containing protein [candidate division KSB1 bacterium]